MSLESNGFFSPGKWGFMEGWPRGADSPVFDVCYGEVHVARLMKTDGSWRVTLRNTPEISTDLASLVAVLNVMAQRLKDSGGSLETLMSERELNDALNEELDRVAATAAE